MGDFMKIALIDAAKSGDLQEFNSYLGMADIDVNFVNRVSWSFSED